MEFSWFGSATNVIQTLNDNISSSLSALEGSYEETEEEKENERLQLEEEEQNEIKIYKKLLEDGQKQHMELSKQFRVALGELDHYKSKCAELTGEKEENGVIKENISSSISSIELEALKSTVNDMEQQMCLLLREKNDALVKVSKYPELIAEITELKENLISKGENDSKKSEEIDNLVQEYSKLAADSEKQKSTDSLRIREMELENEVLRTKVQALEHSITELADRSTSLSAPPSPSRDRSGSSQVSPATQLISETELKQLKTKLVNLEYDLTEKNETILQLEQKLKSSQQQSLKAPEAPAGMITNEEFQTKELLLSRKLEEIGHLQSDVARLQIEKQEAEATGKSFYEMYRNLQRELEAEKKKSLEGTSNVDALSVVHNTQLTILEAKLIEAQETVSKLTDEKDSISLKLESKSRECDDMTSKVESLQNENCQLLSSTASDFEATISESRSKIDKLENEKASLISSHEDAIKNLQSKLETTIQELQSLQTEKVQLNSQLSSSSSEKESLISELRLSIENLEKSRMKLIETHQHDLQQLRIDLETQHLSNADGEMKKTIENLTSLHKEQEDKIREVHQSELSTLSSEIDHLKEQASQSVSEFHRETETLRKEHEHAIKDLQEKIQDLEQKHLDEVRSLEESLQKLEEQLIREGKELSDRNVSEALLQAGEKHTSLLLIQKENFEKDTIVRIQQTIAEQEQLQQTQLQRQKESLEKARDDALSELTNQLKTEAEEKIMELNLQHQKDLTSLRVDCDAILESSLQKARSEHDEKMNFEQLNHAREIEKLQAEHQDVLDGLNEVINELKRKLQSIESVHAENLRKELNTLTISKDAEKENAIQNVRSEMQSLVDTAYTQRDEYLALYTKENKTRKALHNKLMDIQGNIRVICRVRPILDVERRSGEGIDATEILSDEDIVVHRDASTKNKFEFDRVLPPGTPQETVFEAVQPLVISVLDGYNVCIFAYGQTGSGKTFTMEGYGTDIGVSPRAISELFNVVNNCEDWNYTISFSSLEIYNESIRDLLDNSGAKDKLDVRQTPEGNTVPGLTEVPVIQSEQVLELMRQSQTNRAVGAHDMNEHSSRSHSILTLTCRGRNLRDGTTTFGKLHLIDLAGSERVGKTDATGERLKEAQNINRSLSALGDVINSLGKKSSHVPYRNSKLTFLLQDSLGGNSKVLMFVNISPAVYNVGESICSLGFAARCRSLELGQAKKQSDKSAEPVKKAASSANLLNTSTSSDSGLTTPAKTPASSTIRRPTIAPSTRK